MLRCNFDLISLLLFQLEDKRVIAERNLAIFKVRYESLQKAYAVAKNEILKMKVCGFVHLYHSG